MSGLVLNYTAAPAPVITTQPFSQTVAQNGSVTFTTVATGSPAPLTYQWQYNDGDIGGETSPTLTKNGLQDGDSGNYRVKVTDGNGRFSYSTEAAFIVAPPTPLVVFDPSSMAGFGNPGSYAPGIANFFSVVAGTSVSVNQLGLVTPNATIAGTVTIQLWDATAVKVLGTVTFTSSDTGVASGGGTYLYLKATTNNIKLGPGSYAVAQYGGSYANSPVAGASVNTGNGAIANGVSKYYNGGGGGGRAPCPRKSMARHRITWDRPCRFPFPVLPPSPNNPKAVHLPLAGR